MRIIINIMFMLLLFLLLRVEVNLFFVRVFFFLFGVFGVNIHKGIILMFAVGMRFMELVVVVVFLR